MKEQMAQCTAKQHAAQLAKEAAKQPAAITAAGLNVALVYAGPHHVRQYRRRQCLAQI